VLETFEIEHHFSELQQCTRGDFLREYLLGTGHLEAHREQLDDKLAVVQINELWHDEVLADLDDLFLHLVVLGEADQYELAEDLFVVCLPRPLGYLRQVLEVHDFAKDVQCLQRKPTVLRFVRHYQDVQELSNCYE